MCILQLNIGRRITKQSATLVAVRHRATDAVAAPQHCCCLCYLTGSNQLTDSGAADNGCTLATSSRTISSKPMALAEAASV